MQAEPSFLPMGDFDVRDGRTNHPALQVALSEDRQPTCSTRGFASTAQPVLVLGAQNETNMYLN